MDKLRFFLNFLRDRQVASITPTARAAVAHTCRNFERKRPVTVVEYGPGTGVFTRHLMETLHTGSKIIAIDQNADFAAELPRRAAGKRPAGEVELMALHDDARRVDAILSSLGASGVDYVISGIPFSFLSVEDKQILSQKTYQSLKPGGTFVVYQVSFHMEPFLRSAFDRVETHWYWLNLPPLAIMEAHKKP